MLTSRQHELLRFIDGYVKQRGSSPNLGEMAEAMNLKSKTGINRMLNVLEDRGFVRRLPNRARSVEILRLHDTATTAALDDFHNRLRIMVGIDMHELVEAGAIAANDRNAWESFRLDPYRFFIRADDDTAAKIWSVIERRANKRGFHV
ncbi:MAG: lexA [Microvirga sp.]|jgi:SOS-response transcriptional repressor LexA|nr:lexA [Microvirga sp.]